MAKYKVHIFKTSNNFTVNSLTGNVTADKMEYLVVAGGGGGGYNYGGGGGAGGVLSANSNIIATTYTVTVGAGGSGSSDGPTQGFNGSNSLISGSGFTTVNSVGGGGGGSDQNKSGKPGGSGGGNNINGGTGGSGIPGQGNPGGTDDAAGGGGAGDAGSGTRGGNGVYSTISGSNVAYGGGGGGWGRAPGPLGGAGLEPGGIGGGGAGATNLGNIPAVNGNVNTGGGGGGGFNQETPGPYAGADGGSGIVIIRYPLLEDIAVSRISFVSNSTSNVTTFFADRAVRFTTNTRNAANGEILYYVVTGNAAPYVDPQFGTFTINGNVGTVDIRPVYSDTVERLVGLQIRRGSSSGPILAVSNNANVYPNTEVFVSGSISSTSILESEAVEIKLNTSYATNTRNYYYEVFGTANIVGSTTGTTKSGPNLVVIAESNVPTGQTRTFYVTIKEDNSSGNIVYTSPNVTVSAYTSGVVNSRVSIVNSVTANTTFVTKNNAISWTINTTNATNGETLYFDTIGTLVSSDLVGGNTGSFTVTNNTATVIKTISGSADLTTSKLFDLGIRRGSSTGTLLNQSTQNIRTYDTGAYVNATGGTITTGGGYRTHTFTTSDQFTVNGISTTAPRNIIDYLIVAGGGGGGGTDGNGVAGGGGGGMINATATIGAGAYNVTVGGGGGGGLGNPGGNGGPSDIVNWPGFLGQNVPVNLSSVGGGGGRGRYGSAQSGGSGGGGSTDYDGTSGTVPGAPGTAGQGNAGGSGQRVAPSSNAASNGGGGGGKGGVGGNSNTTATGAGGAGGTWPINGVIYAAGGGGSRYPNSGGAGGSSGVGGGGGGTGGAGSNTDAANGLTNRGGGGGAALAIAPQGGNNRFGGSGGSGIVIIRYPYA